MPDATWKAAERKLATLLGGERVGPAGTPQPDVVTPTLVAEVKHRKALPRWLLDAVEQARAQRDIQRMPVAILHQKGQRYEHSLLVVRLDDFLEHVRGAGGEQAIANTPESL